MEPKDDCQDNLEKTDQSKSVSQGESTLSKPLSKNQMKKLARRERMLAVRKEKRKFEKEKKKRKRQELLQLRQENGDDLNVASIAKKTKLMSESDNKFKVVIDMDFEEFMTDDEIGKAAKQVGRIYSLNRHSQRPCQLYLTSLRGRIRDRFSITNAGYQSWDMNISEKNYLETLEANENMKNNMIYLSGDADESLPCTEDLLKDESKIFIIGGLVDHNRHKSLCYERAQQLGIKTAKLPIKEHVQLCQRHILSTVTVFEILLNVLASRASWKDALVASIPKRKLAPTMSEKINIDHNELDSKNKSNHTSEQPT